MSATNKMIFLCENFGENGHFDLMTNKIPKRFESCLQGIKNQLKFKLQPMTTMKERQMLLDISKCKKKEDMDTILDVFYSKKDLDPTCRYLRLATATAAELWTSRQLLSKEHNESWYRSHVYTTVWDNAFMYDDHFNSKRADCYSNITKEFQDVSNQRVDFILRNINDDVDYLSVEEKPSLKGVKSDLKKGKILQQYMLKKWTKRLRKANVMDQFEAITCQWEGLKLMIFGTKFVSEKNMVTYRKGTFFFPAEETHAASFARLLLAIVSLKRLVLLNYSKLNATLEAKYRYEIEMAKFSSDDDKDDIQLRSDSTAGWDPEVEDNDWIDDTIDLGLKEEVLSALKDIKLEDGIITYNDWEEFVVERVSKKRKR